VGFTNQSPRIQIRAKKRSSVESLFSARAHGRVKEGGKATIVRRCKGLRTSWKSKKGGGIVVREGKGGEGTKRERGR